MAEKQKFPLERTVDERGRDDIHQQFAVDSIIVGSDFLEPF